MIEPQLHRPRLTELAHQAWVPFLQFGGIAVDATAGNGHDSAFIANQLGKGGRLWAIDCQAYAIDATARRLASSDSGATTELIVGDHAQLSQLLPAAIHGRVHLIVFNLGYLPGSDHSLCTQATSTLTALQQALALLAPGGCLSVMAYPGHPDGAVEAQAVAEFIQQLPMGYPMLLSESSRAANPSTPGPHLYLVGKFPQPHLQAAQLATRDFLQVAGQFSLGHLDTESSHPKTQNLSTMARQDPVSAARLLLEVERDALAVLMADELPEWQALCDAIRQTLQCGGRIFLTGCGATGRMAIALETFVRSGFFAAIPADAVAGLMAGGDAALVRSIEGFEDHWDDGVQQILTSGINANDLVIGVTEGGETTWVLATVHAAADLCQRAPWILYCNPTEQLIGCLDRCRKVLEDSRIRRWSIATGPMAIAGSTRMQATSVQMTALAMAFMAQDPHWQRKTWLAAILDDIDCIDCATLAEWAGTEAQALLDQRLLHYTATGCGLTLLTDTTERAPTFSLLPFENQLAQPTDAPAPVFLFFPCATDSAAAWQHILQRPPRCLEWPHCQALTGIARLHGFDLSAQGMQSRIQAGSMPWLHFVESDQAWKISAPDGKSYRIEPSATDNTAYARHLLLKAVLNTLSTMAATQSGRVESNRMTYVRPANLKLIDRAIRTITTLYQWRTGNSIDYATVAYALFCLRPDLPTDASIVLTTLNALCPRPSC